MINEHRTRSPPGPALEQPAGQSARGLWKRGADASSPSSCGALAQRGNAAEGLRSSRAPRGQSTSAKDDRLRAAGMLPRPTAGIVAEGLGSESVAAQVRGRTMQTATTAARHTACAAGTRHPFGGERAFSASADVFTQALRRRPAAEASCAPWAPDDGFSARPAPAARSSPLASHAQVRRALGERRRPPGNPSRRADTGMRRIHRHGARSVR